MLDQEDLYKLIIKEHWKDILNLLYSNKTIIKTDPLLGQAANIFEQEFFNKIKNYDINRKDILDNLDTLFILNHGKFYEVSTENYKTLILEIVNRKPLLEAYDYAKLFPNEEICINIINKFEESNLKETKNNPKISNITSMNWIEIYNRLFELINQQGDAATYFSGPRFINTVKEFDPYFPDYNQYINQRNQEGKSTSRKIFYYDILIELKEELRLKVIDRILDILRPFQNEKVEIIQDLLGHKVIPKATVVDNTEKKEYFNNPIVFISYSWDNETHKEWVLNLANRLCSDGIEVILDRYYLKPGKNLPHFVETSIDKANRIIIVYTPNYKVKADKRTGGVGYEYSIMNAELYKNQTANEKIIPVLRNGNIEESVPAFMQQFIHIDIRNDENYENSYIDLIREIYNEPAIQKPTLGVKPTFEKNKSESVEKPLIGNKPNLSVDTNNLFPPAILSILQ